ncbi:MAG: hypothetical protein K6C30_06055 [Bacteroidaceae bacterium]|nr:hypothetical protein [Bacteroidaceae bacterium]
MRKNYLHPQIKLCTLTAVEQLLSDSQTSGPTADYMSNPTVSSSCNLKSNQASAYSVWDDDWSK